MKVSRLCSFRFTVKNNRPYDYTEYENTRKTRMIRLLTELDARLQQLEVKMTQDGRTRDATRVREKRNEIKNRPLEVFHKLTQS